MNCALLMNIVIVVSVLFILSCTYEERYARASQGENVSPGNVIGVVYPPRAGPLHRTDVERDGGTEIYDVPPYIRKY